MSHRYVNLKMIKQNNSTKLPIGAASSGQVDQAFQYKLTNAKLRKVCTDITLKDYEFMFLSKLFSCVHVIMTDLSKMELSSVLISPNRSDEIYQCEYSTKMT